MQKSGRGIMVKYRVYYVLLFIVLILGDGTRTFAHEIELVQRSEEEAETDIAYFNIQVSPIWTSKGKAILSYDVSESGDIVISFPNNKLGVFDENMNFLFELSFDNGGAYGALWHGKNILLVDVRYPAVVECSEDGEAVNSYTVISNNYYYCFVEKRLRKCGEYEYYCKNNGEDGSELTHYAYYTTLRRTSEENGEEILYKSDNIIDGEQLAKFFILLFLAGSATVIGVFVRMIVVCRRKWMEEQEAKLNG